VLTDVFGVVFNQAQKQKVVGETAT